MDANIDHRVEKDKYGNEVSIITLADGRTYRMVHYTPRGRYTQNATIYAGRGKFMRLHTHYTDNDCQVNSFRLGDYRISWGDGDPVAVASVGDVPNLDDLLYTLREDDDNAIIAILTAVGENNAVWSYRDFHEGPRK